MRPLFVIDLNGDVLDEDIEAVCQPDQWEQVVRVTEPRDATMEALAALAGMFSSRGQARVNGFRGSVPWGLNLWGTNRCTFWVWNPKPPTTTATISRKRDKTEQWFAFAQSMGWV